MYEPFPDNYVWNLSVNLSLSTGGQFTEVLDAITPILPLAARGDEATGAWVDAWECLGDRVAELAGEELAAGAPLSAGQRYIRAANYFMIAERFHATDSERRTAVYQKVMDALDAFIAHGGEPVSRVEIPYKGGSFPALFYRAPDAPPASPAMIQFNGLDSTKSRCGARRCAPSSPVAGSPC